MTEPLEKIQERMVLARCQAGDADAFVEIVARYQSRLAYFVQKVGGNASGIDDVLQNVWLDVFRSLGKLADPAAFPAWVYRIARNRAYRELRRPRRTTSIDAVPDMAAPEEDESFALEEVELVHECLDEMSDEHREALVLRFLEDMSYENIAAVVGCSLGTVRSRLHYAKIALRTALNRRRMP